MKNPSRNRHGQSRAVPPLTKNGLRRTMEDHRPYDGMKPLDHFNADAVEQRVQAALTKGNPSTQL